MRTLHTEIEIDAPPAVVWDVLTDFPRHKEWNPLFSRLDGVPAAGERLTMTIALQGKRPMTFRPRILRADPERELCWLGRLWIPGLFDGQHRFVIEPLSGGSRVRFIQAEEFRGLLVPLFWGGMEDPTREGFERMNEALKRTAEARAHAG